MDSFWFIVHGWNTRLMSNSLWRFKTPATINHSAMKHELFVMNKSRIPKALHDTSLRVLQEVNDLITLNAWGKLGLDNIKGLAHIIFF